MVEVLLVRKKRLVVVAVQEAGSLVGLKTVDHNMVGLKAAVPVLGAFQVGLDALEDMDTDQRHRPKGDMVWQVGAVFPAHVRARCCSIDYSEMPILPMGWSVGDLGGLICVSH